MIKLTEILNEAKFLNEEDLRDYEVRGLMDIAKPFLSKKLPSNFDKRPFMDTFDCMDELKNYISKSKWKAFDIAVENL